MEKINCTIERITFQNPENGYSVLQATVKGYREEQTIVGTFHEVTVGAVLIVEGNWRVDKRYGRQFAVESWTEELPATVIGIEKYLGSGLVKGIGPKFAKQIVSHFGLETFEVIENDIDRLLEVPNIGKGRVAKIKESWEKQKDVKDIMVFLQGHGVSSTYAAKIYKQYGKLWLMNLSLSLARMMLPKLNGGHCRISWTSQAAKPSGPIWHSTTMTLCRMRSRSIRRL